MPRNQTVYNAIGVYASANVASGYSFITDDKILINDSSFNSLIFPLNRIQSFNYSINQERNNISNLGNLGTIARPILNPAEVEIGMSYYLAGLINEARIGMYVNVPSGDSYTGIQLYGTGRVCPITGFYTRDTRRIDDLPDGWPVKVREPRNLFVASRKQDGLDFNDITTGSYKNTEVDVYSFGDCYLNSYKVSAAISQIPIVNISFVGSNIEVYSSGTNCDIPSLNPQTNNIYSGRKFSIPNNFQGIGLPTVLLPKDLTVSIKQQSNNSENLTDLFLDFTDIKLQSFEFDINLTRNNLYGIGYKQPLDRQLQFPVLSNLNFSLLPGDNKSGSLNSLLKRDENYDINIKLNYQSNTTGWAGTAIQYDFIGAKFNGFGGDISISNRLNNNLSFTTELRPNDTTKGLFISGYLSIPHSSFAATYLGDDFQTADGSFDNLLTQDGDLFAISLGGQKILY